MRSGPQGASKSSSRLAWLAKRITAPSRKRGSQAGESGLRLAVTHCQVWLRNGGPLQTAP